MTSSKCGALCVLLMLAGAAEALAGTLFVAETGADSSSCGTLGSPCRSISQAVSNANSGDEIVVGPGVYGDVDGDGTFTSGAGDETPGGSGMIAVTKTLSIVSSSGAASTMIVFGSGGGVAQYAVEIDAAGSRFGKVDAGFTIRGQGGCNAGIRVIGADAIIEGNTLTRCFRGADVTGAGAVIAHNLARENAEVGFLTRSEGAVVEENYATSNGFTGFVTESLSWQMSRNASIGNSGDGATVDGNGFFTNNAMIGNLRTGLGVNGFLVAGLVNLTITANSFYANRSLGGNCGIFNNTFTTLIARGNFWGLPTGPGDDPADRICGNAIDAFPWLASPTADADVYGPLVQGVGRIGGVGFPSAITGWSEDWQIIATGDEDNGPPPTHYAMARPYAKGRVVALGHESLLSHEALTTLDNGPFITNVFAWLDQTHARTVLFTTGHAEGVGDAFLYGLRAMLPTYSFTALTAPLTLSQLPSNAVLLIGHATADFTPGEIEAIRHFVSNGGGLLLAAQGWAWIPYWNRPLDEFPMNRVGEPFKIRWLGANLRDPTNETFEQEAIYHNFYPDLRTMRQMHHINDLVDFTPYDFRTTLDTAGCPAGSVGTFVFDALLRLKGGAQPVSSVAVTVMELSDGNSISNAFGGQGSTGANISVPFQSNYADGIFISGGESVVVPFEVCLESFEPFRFLVDVLGRDEDVH